MSANDYQVPDLASVLRTLATLAPQNQQSVVQEHQPHQPLEYQRPPVTGTPDSQQPWPQHMQPESLTAPKKPTLPKQIDPATIIDWSSGLRCVMKTVAAHDNIINEIRRMISIQHEHEEQWWKGREDLLQKQEARKEGQKKLDEVLKAVGGAVVTGNAKSGPEEAAEELKTFDMKVYRAQHQMVKEMSAKLKSLGVPFFGTRIELVKKPVKDPVKSGLDGPADAVKTISETELVQLQRKMLSLLEDLCQG